jgi:hypothetical protein
MTAESRSAMSVMPIGAGQPPACIETGPWWSTCTNSTIDTTTIMSRIDTLITRWVARERPNMIESAAPMSGTTIGRTRSALTTATPRPR